MEEDGFRTPRPEGGGGRLVVVKLNKEVIGHKIDARTYKRSDALPSTEREPEAAERIMDAVASDSHEGNDAVLVAGYRDRRDAEVRMALAFCLEEPEPEEGAVLTNMPVPEKAHYVYRIRLPEGLSEQRARAAASLIEDYIVRGAVFDWMLGVGMQGADTFDTLDELLDSISAAFRGRSWLKRPLQPFGPADPWRR